MIWYNFERKRKGEKSQGTKDKDDCHKIVCSRHYRNTEPLALISYDCLPCSHKIMVLNIPVWTVEDTQDFTPSWGATSSRWFPGEGISFCEVPRRPQIAQVLVFRPILMNLLKELDLDIFRDMSFLKIRKWNVVDCGSW